MGLQLRLPVPAGGARRGADRDRPELPRRLLPAFRPDDKPAQPDLFTALAVGERYRRSSATACHLAKIGAEPVDEATLKPREGCSAFAEYINAIATAYAGSCTVPNAHDLTVLPELVQIDFLYAL
ncbi:MAG: hypothetical protein U0Z44_20205 [Kouleothrix sp.]